MLSGQNEHQLNLLTSVSCVNLLLISLTDYFLNSWPLGDLKEILDSKFQANFSDQWLRYLLWIALRNWMSLDLNGKSTLVQASGNMPLPVTWANCAWVFPSLTHWGRLMHIRVSKTPTLLQIMACRLFGAKPLSESVLPYHQLDPEEHISVKFYHDLSFHSRKCTLKVSSVKWRPFCLRLNGSSRRHLTNVWWNNAELSLWPGIKKLRFPVFVLIERFNES